MNSRNPYSFLSCRIKREAGTHTKAEVIVMSKATRIAITPQELYDASAQFNQKADEIRDIITYMRQQIASLDGSWEGAAKTQYFVNFDEMGKMLDSIPAAFLRHSAWNVAFYGAASSRRMSMRSASAERKTPSSITRR